MASLFVVCIPTAQHEKEIVENGRRSADDNKSDKSFDKLKSGSSPKLNGKLSEEENEVEVTKSAEHIHLSSLGSKGADSEKELYTRSPTVLSTINEVDKSISSKSSSKETLKLDCDDGKDKDSNSLKVPKSGEESENDIPDGPMEELLEEVLTDLRLTENAVWCKGRSDKYYQVFFPVGNFDACEQCLQYLGECGIGEKFNSSVSVIPCSIFYQGDEGDFFYQDDTQDALTAEEKAKTSSAWTKFVNSVKARLTVAQVVEGVKSAAELTFDFLMLLLVAGMVAAIGLVENNSVVIVASMLISPLMGPILAGTFGAVINDRNLQKMGVLNELVGLLMCLLIGFFFGLVVGAVGDPWGYIMMPTPEMSSRGMLRSLWVGILIALPSGAGVALSVLGNNAGCLVGVAISASLLPPAVNAGLLWALSCITLLKEGSEGSDWAKTVKDALNSTTTSTNAYKPIYTEYLPVEYAYLGGVSLCLTLLNIVCIFIAGIIVLKVKEVAPQASQSDTRRFWKHDIKIARNYNKTLHQEEGKNLGKQLLDELGGTIPNEDLGSLEAAAMQEAANDAVFRKVRRLSFFQRSPEITTHLGLVRTNSTWSPNTTGDEERPTMQELESLYTSMNQNQSGGAKLPQNPQQFHPQGQVRKHSLTRMPSVGRPQWAPNATQANGLPTILETNPNVAGRHISPTGRLMSMSSPMYQQSQQRFIVTPVQQNVQGPRTRRRSTITESHAHKTAPKLPNYD